ncbi:hypothetical protein V8J88_03865 [Massilia sp. W12]|uniref:hypothetical protein n=1 Tax=Massilia sp. W12 TaxID=3126507 RepID=UPI0030CC7E18
MKTYEIISGSFAMPDGTCLSVGDKIDLPDDVAALHPHQLKLLQPPANKPVQKKADD